MCLVFDLSVADRLGLLPEPGRLEAAAQLEIGHRPQGSRRGCGRLPADFGHLVHARGVLLRVEDQVPPAMMTWSDFLGRSRDPCGTVFVLENFHIPILGGSNYLRQSGFDSQVQPHPNEAQNIHVSRRRR